MKQKCILWLLLSNAAWLRADDPSTSSPSISYQVLSEVKVPVGDHSVILDRVATPIIPQAAAPVVQQVARATQTIPQRPLLVGATVFAHQVTEILWQSTTGKTFRAFSDIDFSVFVGVGGFSTDTASYSLVMNCGNEGVRTLAQLQANATRQGMPAKPIPSLEQFPQGHSGYIMVTEIYGLPFDASDLADMDGLHRYYDANKTALQQAAQVRRVQDANREAWRKAHPPSPKDTVIRYWPKKGTPISSGGATQP